MHSLPLFRSNMAATAARTVAKAVKPHIPSIKFPTRGPQPKAKVGTEPVTGNPGSVDNLVNTAITSKPSSSTSKGPAGPRIESSELPLKYRRKPLTSEEMETIEKGGQI